MIHFCCGCGNPCDCWAFDQSHGDICDKCSDCLNNIEESEFRKREVMKPKDYIYIAAWGRYMGSYSYYIEAQQLKAALENAPEDAIFKGSKGEWSRLSDCSTEMQEEIKQLVEVTSER